MSELHFALSSFSHGRKDYNALQGIIDAESIDVALCDHVSFACQEAAKDSKVPLIITMVINEAEGILVISNQSNTMIVNIFIRLYHQMLMHLT